MKLLGTFAESSERWLGTIQLLDLREVGKSKQELFDKLTARLNIALIELSKEGEVGDIHISELSNSEFEVKFTNTKLICALLIKSLRSIEKVTQERVSNQTKMARESYKQYEEARREPSVSKFNELIEALGYEWTLTLKRKSKK
jgi:Helix-turn-helix domain